MSVRSQRRLAWTLAIVATIIAAIGIGYAFASRHAPLPAQAFGFRGFPGMLAFEFAATGLILATKRPENRVGWLLLLSAVGAGVQQLGDGYAVWAIQGQGSMTVVARLAAVSEDWVWMLGFGSGMLALALFPDGRPLSRRWGRWIWVCVVGTLVSVVAYALTDKPLIFRGVKNPLAVPGMYEVGNATSVFFFFLLITAFASLIVRFRRTSGDEHEQMKWLASSAALLVASFSVYFIGYALTGGTSATTFANVAEGVIVLGVATIPLAIGIGVMKYRLYDIDIVIRKTVVFAVVAGVLTTLYLGVIALATVGTVSRLLGGALLLAVTFGPVRRAARSIADRLVYGRRATSYEVLTDFSHRMADTYATDDVLPRMATVVQGATSASSATVWLLVARELRPVARSGGSEITGSIEMPADGALPALPGDFSAEVRHQGELLGALSVEMPANDPLDPTRQKLVLDLAAQAGLVLRNVRLIEELKASRQRLVAAQDEERRRLERNIHDGVQQHLVALAVQARLADGLVGREEEKQHQALADLQDGLTVALDELRDLARGIYPPLLADKGLPAALEAQARRAAVPTTVIADDVGRYPKEIESALYFSVLEALTNVAKYAAASSAEIRVAQEDGRVSFSVTDDGRGFDPNEIHYGTGLQGIADRLSAIGGELDVTSEPGVGTKTAGWLPIGGDSS